MGYFITGILTRRRFSKPPKCGSCWFCVADILAIQVLVFGLQCQGNSDDGVVTRLCGKLLVDLLV